MLNIVLVEPEIPNNTGNTRVGKKSFALDSSFGFVNDEKT
jgi:tRNA(Leu) C34 or U34 (ribose-2'-O)-methylase TrmL